MEYRGVHTKTGKELFHVGPMIGTNNIGEFLAIVHALAWLQQQNKVCRFILIRQQLSNG